MILQAVLNEQKTAGLTQRLAELLLNFNRRNLKALLIFLLPFQILCNQEMFPAFPVFGSPYCKMVTRIIFKSKTGVQLFHFSFQEMDSTVQIEIILLPN